VQRRRATQPAQVVALGFLFVIVVGTVLLSLPFSRTDGKYGGGLEALFTAVSAVCVTGLSTVDVEHFWTPIGHLVILALIKIGGFGIMTFATLLGVLVSNRIGLKNRINVGAESQVVAGGDVRKLLRQVFLVGAAIEFAVAMVLTVRFITFYHYSFGDALWHGYFHAISSFNNAGFALYSTNLMPFVNDGWVQLSLSFAIILGGLGFPVLFELGRRLGRRVEQRRVGGVIESRMHWTLTSRIVLWSTAILLVGGTIYVGAIEWTNPATLGSLDWGSKILNSFTASVYPRTAGFNSLDISQMHPATWLGMDVLMFIGGGSAGTAGGIKVATAAVLVFIVWTEIKGDTAVNIGERRLPRSIQRQALSIVLLAAMVISAAIFAISLMTKFTTDQILFEVVSAFATVGLSTGITGQLPNAAQLILIALMFIGRIGTVAVASAMAARIRHSHFEYPKERPTIG
jgi:potassium uptake TrkH family protein